MMRTVTQTRTHADRAFWAMVSKQVETLGSCTLHSMSTATAAAGLPDRSAATARGIAPRTTALTLGAWLCR